MRSREFLHRNHFPPINTLDNLFNLVRIRGEEYPHIRVITENRVNERLVLLYHIRCHLEVVSILPVGRVSTTSHVNAQYLVLLENGKVRSQKAQTVLTWLEEAGDANVVPAAGSENGIWNCPTKHHAQFGLVDFEICSVNREHVER